jgi:nitrate reductase NapE component
MEEKQLQDNTVNKQDRKKRKSNNFGFLFYAIAVFTILGIGLLVIVMRSRQML